MIEDMLSDPSVQIEAATEKDIAEQFKSDEAKFKEEAKEGTEKYA